MFLFGFASIMQGLVNNYAGLLATRFFLGLFETGMFPGCKSLPFPTGGMVACCRLDYRSTDFV